MILATFLTVSNSWMLTEWWGISFLFPLRLKVSRLSLRHSPSLLGRMMDQFKFSRCLLLLTFSRAFRH